MFISEKYYQELVAELDRLNDFIIKKMAGWDEQSIHKHLKMRDDLVQKIEQFNDKKEMKRKLRNSTIKHYVDPWRPVTPAFLREKLWPENITYRRIGSQRRYITK